LPPFSQPIFLFIIVCFPFLSAPTSGAEKFFLGSSSPFLKLCLFWCGRWLTALTDNSVYDEPIFFFSAETERSPPRMNRPLPLFPKLRGDPPHNSGRTLYSVFLSSTAGIWRFVLAAGSLFLSPRRTPPPFMVYADRTLSSDHPRVRRIFLSGP